MPSFPLQRLPCRCCSFSPIPDQDPPSLEGPRWLVGVYTRNPLPWPRSLQACPVHDSSSPVVLHLCRQGKHLGHHGGRRWRSRFPGTATLGNPVSSQVKNKDSFRPKWSAPCSIWEPCSLPCQTTSLCNSFPKGDGRFSCENRCVLRTVCRTFSMFPAVMLPQYILHIYLVATCAAGETHIPTFWTKEWMILIPSCKVLWCFFSRIQTSVP